MKRLTAQAEILQNSIKANKARHAILLREQETAILGLREEKSVLAAVKGRYETTTKQFVEFLKKKRIMEEQTKHNIDAFIKRFE